MVYRPRRTEVRTFSHIPCFVRSARTFSLISLMLKNEFLSALMRIMATLSSAQIYACRKPLALNFGKHRGIQCSFPFKKEVLLNTIEKSNCISDIRPFNRGDRACRERRGKGGKGYPGDGDCVAWDE